MTVNYKGFDDNFKYRLAEINFEEMEEKLYSKLEKAMNIKGWNLQQVTDGYASCEVDSYAEYREFVKDYKEVKKSAKLWMRFGF